MALPPSVVVLPTAALPAAPFLLAGRLEEVFSALAASWPGSAMLGLLAAAGLLELAGLLSERSGVPPGLSAIARPGRAASAQAVAAKTFPSSSSVMALISASLASYIT